MSPFKLGGGLGRKAETDFVGQAVQVGMAIKRPVKLMWPREDDFTHDQYRPMALMHARAGITADGTVLRDVAVFRAAYRLIGLGWLYAPSAWPGLRQLADGLYGLWAHWRLPLTGRPDLDQLCSCRPQPHQDPT